VHGLALRQRPLFVQSRTLGPESGSPPGADFVSVFVSFVVVRGGSLTLADGLVEHVADVDDRP
jgi:hypothetical protein